MEFTPAAFLLATGSILIGSLMQAVTGLGAGLVIVPLLALVSFHLVPAPMIFASIALSSMMAYNGRKQIDPKGLKNLTAGLIAGTVVAAIFIASVPLEKLGIIFGIALLAAVGITLFLKRLPFRPVLLLISGFISGIMGTAAGIGAPVLALLYQHHEPPVLRATLAYLYLISSVMMLLFLNLAGRFGMAELILGLYLVPGFLLGYFLSPRLARIVDKQSIRPFVIVFATFSALLLIAKSL